MFLRNWYNILAASIMTDGTASNNSRLYVVDFSGTGKYVGAQSYNMVALKGKAMFEPSFPKSTTANDYGVWFGDGDVEPTLNDCNLSGKVLLSSEASGTGSCVSAMDSNTGEASLTGTYTITNNRDTDIVIREVGIVLNVDAFASTTATSSFATYVMVERSLLDEPVTIAPGGFGQVVYTVKMNWPTA